MPQYRPIDHCSLSSYESFTFCPFASLCTEQLHEYFIVKWRFVRFLLIIRCDCQRADFHRISTSTDLWAIRIGPVGWPASDSVCVRGAQPLSVDAVA